MGSNPHLPNERLWSVVGWTQGVVGRDDYRAESYLQVYCSELLGGKNRIKI